MDNPTALIIDDEPDLRELLEITLNRMQINTKSAATLKEAKELLNVNEFNFCLTDMRLPDGDGLELVNYLQKNHPHLPIAIITAHGSMETAIAALKKGAFDFITKPLDLQVLRNLVKTALQLNHIPRESPVTEHSLIGNTPIMKQLKEKLKKLALSQAPIYISGPSGSGKELVARFLHESGPRANKPFIAINCGAIPKELMESEFFGHKKGSFTGAIQDKPGFFQAAHGGTLFLDEIGELPLEMQVKLLRCLQTKTIRAIGETKESIVDVRILSATNKNLNFLVENQIFREDLFYRINVIEVEVPALKDRVEDIPILVQFILNKLCQKLNRAPPILQENCISLLSEYTYPGNVRELENILERALTLCENNIILASDLYLSDSIKKKATEHSMQPLFNLGLDNLESYLEGIEKNLILKALEKTRWIKSEAAQLLKISLRTLRYKIKKLNLE
ncbi:MAG: type 4 fimbriae expression regulatory protein [Francisellaceae bacterium]|nr:type 4 fimbriae expression regulatory protein [Francisellaceae bacterium]